MFARSGSPAFAGTNEGTCPRVVSYCTGLLPNSFAMAAACSRCCAIDDENVSMDEHHRPRIPISASQVVISVYGWI